MVISTKPIFVPRVLVCDELNLILNPKDVYGPDFPGGHSGC